MPLNPPLPPLPPDEEGAPPPLPEGPPPLPDGGVGDPPLPGDDEAVPPPLPPDESAAGLPPCPLESLVYAGHGVQRHALYAGASAHAPHAAAASMGMLPLPDYAGMSMHAAQPAMGGEFNMHHDKQQQQHGMQHGGMHAGYGAPMGGFSGYGEGGGGYTLPPGPHSHGMQQQVHALSHGMDKDMGMYAQQQQQQHMQQQLQLPGPPQMNGNQGPGGIMQQQHGVPGKAGMYPPHMQVQGHPMFYQHQQAQMYQPQNQWQ